MQCKFPQMLMGSNVAERSFELASCFVQRFDGVVLYSAFTKLQNSGHLQCLLRTCSGRLRGESFNHYDILKPPWCRTRFSLVRASNLSSFSLYLELFLYFLHMCSNLTHQFVSARYPHEFHKVLIMFLVLFMVSSFVELSDMVLTFLLIVV